FLISQIHSAVSDQEPLFELRIGSPTPRQPPISGLSSASASWAAARAAAASGLAFPFLGWPSAAATNARNDPNSPADRNFETGFMTATAQDGSKTFCLTLWAAGGMIFKRQGRAARCSGWASKPVRKTRGRLPDKEKGRRRRRNFVLVCLSCAVRN